MRDTTLLILDVESVGLNGEGFAWGAVLVQDNEVHAERIRWCHPDKAIGNHAGRIWVNENVVPALIRATGVPNCETAREVRDEFWAWYSHYDPQIVAADTIWPVEATFLSACIADDPDPRYFNGPYPFWDISTLRAVGLIERAPNYHDPLMDARESWFSLKPLWLNR